MGNLLGHQQEDHRYFLLFCFVLKHLSDVFCAANTAIVALLRDHMYPTDQQIEECLSIEFGVNAIRDHRFNFRSYSANAVRTTRWAWKDELRQVRFLHMFKMCFAYALNMLTCVFTAGLGERVQHRLACSEKVQRRHRRPVRETPGRGHGRPRDQRCLAGGPR